MRARMARRIWGNRTQGQEAHQQARHEAHEAREYEGHKAHRAREHVVKVNKQAL